MAEARTPRLIYHVCREADWRADKAVGAYGGSRDDLRDGFMHFSTAEQLQASVARHRPGEQGLLLVTVATEPLGSALKWEPGRGGDLFPHLYGPLPQSAVVRLDPLPLAPDGRHRFPPLAAA